MVHEVMLTSKETGLLTDMKGQEELCIEKYGKYADLAKSGELKSLFQSMKTVEEHHLNTVTQMMNGTAPTIPDGKPLENAKNDYCAAVQYASEADRKADAFLCRDMLSTEKHVSSLYDVSIFEFKDPAFRKALNHIQAEEQQHGEQLYAFMNANGMYS